MADTKKVWQMVCHTFLLVLSVLEGCCRVAENYFSILKIFLFPISLSQLGQEKAHPADLFVADSGPIWQRLGSSRFFSCISHNRPRVLKVNHPQGICSYKMLSCRFFYRVQLRIQMVSFISKRKDTRGKPDWILPRVVSNI